MSLQSSNFDRLSTHLAWYLFVHHVDVVVEASLGRENGRALLARPLFVTRHVGVPHVNPHELGQQHLAAIFTWSLLFVFGVRPGLPRVLLLDLLRLADVVWLDARFCRGSSWDFLSRRDRLCFFFFSSFCSFSSEELETGEGAEERVV